MTNFNNIAKLIFDNWGSELSTPIFDDGEFKITRSDFIGQAAVRVQELLNLTDPGECIIVVAGRGCDYFVDMFAIWSVGCIAVPVSNDATNEYLEYVVNISGANLACSDAEVAHVENTITEITGNCSDIVYREGSHNDLCAILFTSGSTGEPKGVMLSHAVIAQNSLSVLDVIDMHQDRLFVNVPFNFTSPICHFIACAFSESTFVGLEKKLFLIDLVQNVRSKNVTCFGGAPVQIRWIGEAIKNSSNADIQGLNLKFVLSSGDHLSVDVIDVLKSALPDTKIYTVYGLTELGGRFCILRDDELIRRIGSVGKPIAGLGVSILSSDTGEECEVDMEGEVVASGDLLFNGYYNNREATKKSMASGRFKTGDLGYLDVDGYLYLSGRSDDVFKVNGQKVSAVLIMNEMMKLDFFEDVGVVSGEDKILGTIAVAFFVLKCGEFKKGMVLRELRKCLPSSHIPQRFVQVSSIPRTGSGKVRRSKLRDLLMEKSNCG